MARSETPRVVIEGMEVIIERDLKKHQSILERTKQELVAYRQAASHEIAKKKHYRKLIGGGKYNDEALEAALKDIRVNIRHLTDKAEASEEKIKHEDLIVRTLTKQLAGQIQGLEELARYRITHAHRN